MAARLPDTHSFNVESMPGAHSLSPTRVCFPVPGLVLLAPPRARRAAALRPHTPARRTTGSADGSSVGRAARTGRTPMPLQQARSSAGGRTVRRARATQAAAVLTAVLCCEAPQACVSGSSAPVRPSQRRRSSGQRPAALYPIAEAPALGRPGPGGERRRPRTACRRRAPAPGAPACAGTPPCGCTRRLSPG